MTLYKYVLYGSIYIYLNISHMYIGGNYVVLKSPTQWVLVNNKGIYLINNCRKCPIKYIIDNRIKLKSTI